MQLDPIKARCACPSRRRSEQRRQRLRQGLDVGLLCVGDTLAPTHLQLFDFALVQHPQQVCVWQRECRFAQLRLGHVKPLRRACDGAQALAMLGLQLPEAPHPHGFLWPATNGEEVDQLHEEPCAAL